MLYEWDEAKREVNLRKHGFDFAFAPLIYEAEFKITIESPRASENRWVDVAALSVEGRVLSLVYARRHEAVRVVSLRKANRKELRLYEKAKDQPLQQ